jgi:ABC-type cobalamin/Fe3+-siderophores transport system ATPase subunit
VFLGYRIDDQGVCPLAVHPLHGSDTYPVSLFTSAPLPIVHYALRATNTPPPKSSSDSRCSSVELDTLLRVQCLDLPYAQVSCCADTRDCEVGSATTAAVSPLLLHALDLTIVRGCHVLVRGASASGKSTLLRALRGLVPIVKGSVRWSDGVTAVHVPQEPLLIPGQPLAAQLTYPDTQAHSEAYLTSLLEAVECQALIRRCQGQSMRAPGSASTVSGGEGQCLMLARVLHARPDVVLLDESTNALPVAQALRLVQLLQDSGITVVLVSHTPEMTPLFSMTLTLDAESEAGWRLGPTDCMEPGAVS